MVTEARLEPLAICDYCGGFVEWDSMPHSMFDQCVDCFLGWYRNEHIDSERYDDYDDPVYHDEKSRDDFINMRQTGNEKA